MAKDLKAYLDLDPGKYRRGMRSVRQLSVKTSRQIGAAFARVGRTLTSLPALITAGFVGINVAKAIGAASAMQETRSKFKAVFKDLTKENAAWAEDFARQVGRGTTQVMGYMARFQDTFVPMGFARNEAAMLSQELTRLGVDLASFNNVAEADALNDLQSALVGNHETMRKYGVIIMETTLKAKGMEMGLATAKGEMTQAAKMLVRYILMLEGTKDAQGDAERTAGQWANQMRRAKADLTALYAAAGDYIIQSKTGASAVATFNETVGLLTDYLNENRDAAIAAGDAGVDAFSASVEWAQTLTTVLYDLQYAWLAVAGGMKGAIGLAAKAKASVPEWAKDVGKAMPILGEVIEMLDRAGEGMNKEALDAFADQMIKESESDREKMTKLVEKLKGLKAGLAAKGEQRKGEAAKRKAERDADKAKRATEKAAREKLRAAMIQREKEKVLERERLNAIKDQLKLQQKGWTKATHSLESELAKREKAYEKYGDAAKRIEEEIANTQRTFQERMFDRGQQGKTAAEQRQALRARGDEYARQAQAAASKGRLDEARRLLQQAQEYFRQADDLKRQIESEGKGQPGGQTWHPTAQPYRRGSSGRTQQGPSELDLLRQRQRQERDARRKQPRDQREDLDKIKERQREERDELRDRQRKRKREGKPPELTDAEKMLEMHRREMEVLRLKREQIEENQRRTREEIDTLRTGIEDVRRLAGEPMEMDLGLDAQIAKARQLAEALGKLKAEAKAAADKAKADAKAAADKAKADAKPTPEDAQKKLREKLGPGMGHAPEEPAKPAESITEWWRRKTEERAKQEDAQRKLREKLGPGMGHVPEAPPSYPAPDTGAPPPRPSTAAELGLPPLKRPPLQGEAADKRRAEEVARVKEQMADRLAKRAEQKKKNIEQGKAWGDEARKKVEELTAKMKEAQDTAAEPMELESNAPEAKDEIEQVKKAIDALPAERHIKLIVHHEETHAGGGWAGVGYYRAGGHARGTDTVHAMLTPGEFVVRRSAAQANRGLLEAINAGATFPARQFARGGLVGGGTSNSSTVVNVTLTGRVDRQTVRREIIPEIQRAQQRGRI